MKEYVKPRLIVVEIHGGGVDILTTSNPDAAIVKDVDWDSFDKGE